MIITEKIIKKMKSHRCLTDLWDKCDQIGIIKHARSLLMNEAPLNRSLDLIRINFARKGLMETKVSPHTLKVLTYIAKRGYRVKEAFINEGIEHEVKLIRVVIRNNIELDLTSFNIHSILSAIKLYIKEDLKFFIPPEVLDSVIRNKINKNYMKNLKGILFTITNDKRKFFKQLLNIFYQLEMHPHLYKKYSEDFVLAISEVFFPNYFQSDIEIFSNFDIICEILNCESYWDCLDYKDSFFRTLHKITY